jgi:ribosomal-protein-alanine N-acetyltransferase
MNSKANSTPFKFEKITINDLASLMKIEESCHSHPWTEKTFSSCIGGRYFGHYANLEQDADNILGFYIGEYVAEEATLMDICVKPDQQGNGYGKLLLTMFLSEAKKQGATKIWLEVRAKNISAQMLYMNAGFIEINRRTGYYPSSSGFGYEDAIVMSLKL